MANSEQSGSFFSVAQSVKLTFSLTVTFYLTKTENRTQKSLTLLSQYCFESKKMLTSAKLRGPWY